MMKDNPAMDKMDKDEHQMMMSDQARYVVYSKKALDNAAGKRRVLYFYASWCPICRPADLNFKDNVSKIPEDVVVVRVNYNDPDTDQEEKDLAQKYGITYQHTFVQIDAQGNKIAVWNGGQINELLKNIKQI
jgi:thiol-disulfide isomerase/thioredoxin